MPLFLPQHQTIKIVQFWPYKQILCVSSVVIITLDLSILAMTNSDNMGSDFERVILKLWHDENLNKFNLNLQTNGHGKFKAIRFSPRYRTSILIELHRIWWNKLGAMVEFLALHLWHWGRRRVVRQRFNDNRRWWQGGGCSRKSWEMVTSEEKKEESKRKHLNRYCALTWHFIKKKKWCVMSY